LGFPIDLRDARKDEGSGRPAAKASSHRGQREGFPGADQTADLPPPPGHWSPWSAGGVRGADQPPPSLCKPREFTRILADPCCKPRESTRICAGLGRKTREFTMFPGCPRSETREFTRFPGCLRRQPREVARFPSCLRRQTHEFTRIPAAQAPWSPWSGFGPLTSPLVTGHRGQREGFQALTSPLVTGHRGQRGGSWGADQAADLHRTADLHWSPVTVVSGGVPGELTRPPPTPLVTGHRGQRGGSRGADQASTAPPWSLVTVVSWGLGGLTRPPPPRPNA
jgi:hypothetical protein